MPNPKKFTREHVQLLHNAIEALDALLGETTKGGAMYAVNPKAVAGVNRYGKTFRGPLLVVLQLAEQDQRQIHGEKKREGANHG